MGFKRNLGSLRETGRKLVLPVERIKWTVAETLFNKNKNEKISTAVDIGAGTLYWSKWLSRYINKIYAVDIVYEKGQISQNRKIILCNDVMAAMESVKDADTLVGL